MFYHFRSRLSSVTWMLLPSIMALTGLAQVDPGCPRGTHLNSTANKCVTCLDGFYTEHEYHREPECDPCTSCDSRKVQVSSCNATHNTGCQCPRGEEETPEGYCIIELLVKTPVPTPDSKSPDSNATIAFVVGPVVGIVVAVLAVAVIFTAIDKEDRWTTAAREKDSVFQPPKSVVVTVNNKKRGRVSVGGKLELICQADSTTDLLNYSWTRISGGEIVPIPQAHRIIGNQLIIENIQREDSGYYVCAAQNTIGSSLGSLKITEHDNGEHLNWKSLKLKLTATGVLHPNGDKSFQLGSEFRIQGKVIGDNNLKIWWLKNGEQLQRNTLLGQDALELSSVYPDLSAVYVCQAVASGKYPILSCHVHLTSPVRQPPKKFFVTINQELLDGSTLPAHGKLDLTCQADGTPAPSYSWKKIDSRGQTVILPPADTNNTNKLTFQSIKREDAGTYVCIAENKYGSSSACIIVTENILGYPGNITSKSFNLLVGVSGMLHPIGINFYQLGTKFKFTSRNIGNSDLQLCWIKKDGMELQSDSAPGQPALELSGVSSDDLNAYVCKATASGVHHILSCHFKLTVPACSRIKRLLKHVLPRCCSGDEADQGVIVQSNAEVEVRSLYGGSSTIFYSCRLIGENHGAAPVEDSDSDASESQGDAAPEAASVTPIVSKDLPSHASRLAPGQCETTF